MKSTTIAITGIAVPLERLRALQQEYVDALAESMTRSGLLQPIVVRDCPGRGYWVVAGRHRFAAAQKLHWKAIECVILDDCSADDAELVEIDENLIRAELSPAETALHIGRRKAIYERKNGSAKANGARAANKAMGRGDATANFADAFTKDTATKTGQSERKVRLDAARAERVEVLPDIINTSLDKGTELAALAKLPIDEQRKLAARAKAGEQVSARAATNKREPRAEPEINRSTLPKSAREKLDAVIRRHQRALDLEFEQRVRDECRKRIEETILPHYNETHAIHDDLIKTRKGVMDRATYKKMLACLHPDGSMSKERRAEAFHLFSQIEKRLLDEKESPTPTLWMPRTYQEMMELKRKVSEARRAKREANKVALRAR